MISASLLMLMFMHGSSGDMLGSSRTSARDLDASQRPDGGSRARGRLRGLSGLLGGVAAILDEAPDEAPARLR